MRKAKQKALDGFKALGVTARKSVKKVENDDKTQSKLRSPLKTQSKNIQEEKMKPCRVVLEREPKANAKTTAKIKSPEQTDIKNREKIYDYSFDADKTNELDKNSEQMQEYFKKLADEKKITLKKYKPKAVIKNKTDKKVGARKKPRKEDQQVQQKPNLNKVNNKQLRTAVERFKVDSNENVVQKFGNSDQIGSNNKNEKKNNVSYEENVKSTSNSSVKTDAENKLILRHRPTHQSTPISTPLRITRSSNQNITKSTSVLSNITSPCLNVDNDSITFDNNFDDASPMLESSTEKINSAVPLRKSPRKSVQPVATTSANKEVSIIVVEKSSRKIPSPIPGTSKDFQFPQFSVEKTLRKSPRKSVQSTISTSTDKQNSILVLEKTPRKIPSPIPGTSKDFQFSEFSVEKTPRKSPRKSVHFQSTASTSADKENSILVLEKTPRKNPSPIPGTSKDFEISILSMEKTPTKSFTTSFNHCSILSSRSSEKSIFPVKTYTPKKQTERTPLKNISNDNSTFSVSNIDLPDLSTRSNTMASNKAFKSSMDLVLQDDVDELPSLFDSEHPTDESQSKFTKDNYFGFDDDDDDDEEIVAVGNKASASDNKSGKVEDKPIISTNNNHLSELRQKFKQFLHNPVSPSKKGAKTKSKRPSVSKPVSKPMARAESPVASTSRAPPQSTPKIFSESRDNQKDIRSVFSAVNKYKEDGHKDEKNKNNINREPSPLLFEEMETNQDRRKSYSRPTKQYQKRRISIDSDSESDHDDGQASAKTRKIKRKKLVQEAQENKDKDELDKFADEFNSMCDEIDKYELVKVKE